MVSFFTRSLSLRQSFYQNNYWPLKFLKEKKYIFLTHQIEDYFNFQKFLVKICIYLKIFIV